MQLVSTVTVGAGGAASIQFTGIPATGKDLLLLCSLRDTNAAIVSSSIIQFNSDTSAGNYSDRSLIGTGSSVLSVSMSYGFSYTPGADATSNTFSNLSYYVSNYASTVAKSGSMDSVQEHNDTSGRQFLQGTRWSGTSAITSMQIRPNNASNFAQHSTASLYLIS